MVGYVLYSEWCKETCKANYSPESCAKALYFIYSLHRVLFLSVINYHVPFSAVFFSYLFLEWREDVAASNPAG